MTRTATTALAILAMTSSGSCFVPSTSSSRIARPTFLGATSLNPEELPYFIDVAQEDTTAQQSAEPVSPKKSAPKKKAGGAAHKEGVFSPLVLGAKILMGENTLNKVRGKAIGLHSDVIGQFVDTYDTPSGQAALKLLFKAADLDKNGAICAKELQMAVQALGFTWLKEKQVQGIFKRADKDGNGMIEYEEFIAEAPKTLRTNLVKLAKKNGGEMGLLV